MRMSNGIRGALFAIILLAACGTALARGFIQNPALLDRIRIGVTTEKEVEQILGPPAGRSHFPKRNLTSMDYTIAGDMGKNRDDVGIIIDNAGIVRDIQRLPQYRGG
jgi:outer membrane protein assembly factor BamE (lipoprotein component of BamABCDE complex)